MLSHTTVRVGATALCLFVCTAGCGAEGGSDDRSTSGTDAPSALPWGPETVPPEPPVLLAAHGAVMLADGTFTDPTPELALAAQRYYMTRLWTEADETTRATFASLRETVVPVDPDDTEALAIANSELLEWLIERTETRDVSQLSALNAALVVGIRAKHPELVDGARIGEKLGTVAQVYPGGEKYAEACMKAGVPMPPSWGDTSQFGWQEASPKKETLVPNFVEGTARAFYYESTNPPGLCMALPRYFPNAKGDSANFLGIICQGNETSKACFWDLNGGFIDVEPKGQTYPIVGSVFQGGGEIPTGGVCSGCHAGENAFVVHEGSQLDLGARNLGHLLYAKGYVTPLVRSEWPQDRRPGRRIERFVRELPGSRTCLECHNKRMRRRFPRLGDLTGDDDDVPSAYCTMIVDKNLAYGLMPPPPLKLRDYIQDAQAMVSGCGYSPNRDATRFVSVRGASPFPMRSSDGVQVGDFNNDGKDDLVRFAYGSAMDVWVARSLGTELAPMEKWSDSFTGNSYGVNVGDFDADGNDDIMFVENSSNAFAVALSTGAGFRGAEKWWAGGADHVYGVHVVADVNNDRYDDVVTIGRTDLNAPSTDVYVAYSLGWKFKAPVRAAQGFGVKDSRYLTGDVNGDGFGDIVKIHPGATPDVFVLPGQLYGFSPSEKWRSKFPVEGLAARLADVTGDGLDDLVSFTRDTGDVYVAKSNGTSFEAPTRWHTDFAGATGTPLLGDIDGDYHADVIAVYADLLSGVAAFARAVP